MAHLRPGAGHSLRVRAEGEQRSVPGLALSLSATAPSPFLGGWCFLIIYLFVAVLVSVTFKSVSRALAATLLLSLLVAPRAQAQRKGKPVNADGSLAAPTPARPARLQPLFGGITPAQATQVIGEARLKAIAASFASAAEASTFFSTKGYEYLSENQPDTAAYRFNLAWLLNQQNADAYHGLGIVASAQPTPDAAIGLLAKGLALAPASAPMLSDLGISYLIRYGLTKKKKDLTAGMDLLQRATTLDPANAVAWQQQARGLYYQEKYPEAWAAVHKGQALNVSSLDFSLISDLQAKLPDPQGIFK